MQRTTTSLSSAASVGPGAYGFVEYFGDGVGSYAAGEADNGGVGAVVFDFAAERRRRRPAL